MFGYGDEKKKVPRKGFGKFQKDVIIAKQRNCCADCGRKFGRIKPHFHHKDGDRSNNRTSNGRALCPNCHDPKSRRQTKKRNQKKEKTDSFGLDAFSGVAKLKKDKSKKKDDFWNMDFRI